MEKRLLIRDDGVIFGWSPQLATHPRLRPYTPPEKEPEEVIIGDVVIKKEKLPPLNPLASREALMQFIRVNFGVEPNKTRSITEYRKQIEKLCVRHNKEF